MIFLSKKFARLELYKKEVSETNMEKNKRMKKKEIFIISLKVDFTHTHTHTRAILSKNRSLMTKTNEQSKKKRI